MFFDCCDCCCNETLSGATQPTRLIGVVAKVRITFVSSLVSASSRRMMSFVGSDPLLRENPASAGLSWPLSVGAAVLMAADAAFVLGASVAH